MIKINYPFSIALLSLSSLSHAGGLSLSQIGTTQSTATAGVSNVTNNQDASATVSNAAALSGIDDSSFMFGVQYLDVNNDFQASENELTSNGSDGAIIPHISYAKRLNEQWVTGVALHAPGGLGLDYDNGLTGLGLVDTSSITTINLTASASYQVNANLSLGGSIIAQYAAVNSTLSAATKNTEIEADDWTPSFALSALYQINDSTHVGVNYNAGAKHDLAFSILEGSVEQSFNWPQSVEFGLQHQLTAQLSMMASVNWQQWSQFNNGYDDTYGGGVAMSYQLDSWRLHSGISADSSPLAADNRGHALPLDTQWRFGLGAEKKLKNNMVLGLAYQYQSLGDAQISGSGPLNGEYSNNRIHFITASLSF
ncbi:aromatic hydrocarbon degradation protein [Psychromonas sp. psych-6C06]|uniref:OmpP1/FadL family transporter n=1 Tax=Psychromonas sp. psych-6C06 TaxID=2058089 RepID=UPI000C341AE3|nr:outer membrane protein transport protein [Psychromonas sp. psych-6C06]PKF62503.1 aromatic hydrocarbon degradation protein [Psychromonas sp. psych-6C06]